MKTITFFKVSFLLILLISCAKTEKDVCNDLIGNWAIHKITYKGINYKDKLYSMNVINIRENNTISLPEVDIYKKERKAIWDFSFKKNKLFQFTIKCENEVFKKNYQATFFEEARVDRLILKSATTYIELHKL